MSTNKSVQILNKNIVIDINNGDEKIGEIKFDPNDMHIYTRYIDLIETITTGQKKVNEVHFTEEEKNLKIETIEDFEKSQGLIEKIKRANDFGIDLWNSVCKGLDELFGEGVCDKFTQGYANPDLLIPLFDAVNPCFKEAREKKVNKYTRKK